MDKILRQLINESASKYQSLSIKQNIGELRVLKSGFNGSLWIKTRYNGYRLQTTSGIASFLDKEIERLQGDSVGEHKGYKYWHINDSLIVEKLIEILGKA